MKMFVYCTDFCFHIMLMFSISEGLDSSACDRVNNKMVVLPTFVLPILSLDCSYTSTMAF